MRSMSQYLQILWCRYRRYCIFGYFMMTIKPFSCNKSPVKFLILLFSVWLSLLYQLPKNRSFMFLLWQKLQMYAVRQMLMFSATWPPPVHQLAQEFMDPHPVKVCFFAAASKHFQSCSLVSSFEKWILFQVVVGSEDLAANHDVMQIVEVYIYMYLKLDLCEH